MLTNKTRAILAAASTRPYVCGRCAGRGQAWQLSRTWLTCSPSTRCLQTASQPAPAHHDATAFRKQLKDAAKKQKSEAGSSKKKKKASKGGNARLDKWELTVGIEIHAELNTARKLFSRAATSISEAPNTHAALFDLAFPGTQPRFQTETLLPAIRGALALNCAIQPRSSFDRKHYFYQDQPAGYQITQYYHPFARDGHVVLHHHDFPAGTAPPHCPLTIGIKQVQMEQDTAKTVQQPPSTHLLDFNRVSHPLIEIITLPQIHDPIVAAACVRKIQTILKTVNACTAGMELGGLRADVNVSVRERSGQSESSHSYHGVTGLGQRTEIKNLASVKAVEDAIIAERDRQIDLLESGGAVEGETRGWTLGSKTTKRLRGKEGEIDYRYMPDPDIAPVIVAPEVVQMLQKSLPKLPDDSIDILVQTYGLSAKDAGTLLSLDDGERLEYFFSVIGLLAHSSGAANDAENITRLGKIAGNWILMELGSLFQDSDWDPLRMPPNQLIAIISALQSKQITSRSAKTLLAKKFEGDDRDVKQIIIEEDMALKPLSQAEYESLAQTLLDEKPEMVRDIVEKGQSKKVKWFVGQMMVRGAEGSVEPDTAERVLVQLLEKR